MVCFFTLKILKYVKFILGYDEQYNLTLTTLRKLSGSQKKRSYEKDEGLTGFQQDEEDEGCENN